MNYHEYQVNEDGKKVTIQETGDGYAVWDHEHAVEIGTADTLGDARNMING